MTKIFDISPDKLDRELIGLLRANARAPISELARILGLSRTTVQSRLERLERSKRITGYTIRLSETHERGQIQAYVMIAVDPKQAGRVGEQIKGLSGLRRLQSVSGAVDMIALVDAPSAAELDTLIDAIGALEGVERTTSSIVLGTQFDR